MYIYIYTVRYRGCPSLKLSFAIFRNFLPTFVATFCYIYITVVWITVSLLHYMLVSKGFPLSSGAVDTKSALPYILFCEFA